MGEHCHRAEIGKIARFAKRQLLQHGPAMVLKLDLIPTLVDPKGTTSSREHDGVMKRYGRFRLHVRYSKR